VKKLLVVMLTLAAASGGTGVAVAAKPGPGPIATPASVCRALGDFGAYPSVTACMTRINADVRAYTFYDPDIGQTLTLNERCTQLEQQGITYPFYFGEDPGFPLTQFTAVNHHQCMLTLYAYHFAFGA
jgi:hypothetical protein